MKKLQNNPSQNFLRWIVIISIMMILYYAFNFTKFTENNLIFSDFLNKVVNEEISQINIRGNIIESKFKTGEKLITLSPGIYPDLLNNLRASNVKIEIIPTDSPLNSLFNTLLYLLPTLLLIGFWFFFMRNIQGGGGKTLGFGKSKATLLINSGKKILFKDVAGVDEAKEELTEIVDFLKSPTKFSRLGGKIPKGCLLIGPPGTGKTLLAKAVAGESNVPFFTISGSDFVEMFVGVGASRVRDMFTQTKKHSPCIIFIDEIDAVGRHRGAGLGGGNDEREQTLNQLLVEMDGFTENQSIIIIAATNRPDVLDNALLRPGRFDRKITVSVADIEGRKKILNVHIKKIPIAEDVDINTISKGTPGFSGADLANLVNEAALSAARIDKNQVTMKEFEKAKDKIIMGSERKSMILTNEQKETTAYHESGHALVSLHYPASDPIHKATIIPTSKALGYVARLPENDRYNETKERLIANLAVAFGGRVAEEIIFGNDKITTGAYSDIKYATSIARNMVTKVGFSNKIGPIMLVDNDKSYYSNYNPTREIRISEKLTQEIDAEIKNFLDEAYKAAKKILKNNINKLHILAKALIEYETLSGNEIKNLISGKKIRQHIKYDINTKNKNSNNTSQSL